MARARLFLVLLGVVVGCGGTASAGARSGNPVLPTSPPLPTFTGHLVFTTADGVEHEVVGVERRTSGPGRTVYRLRAARSGRTVVATVRTTSWGTALGVAVEPARGVVALRLLLPAPATAHFLGTGERQRFVDMRGTVQPLKVWNACASTAPAAFFASTAGFGAFLRGDAVGRIAFPNAVDDSNFACDLGSPPCSVGAPTAAVRICVKAASADVELYRGTPAEVVARYLDRSGRPAAPWLPAFGLMKWRDAITGPSELFDDITRLRALHIPIGWVILDNPWERRPADGCFGSLQFDPAAYPDPAGLIRAVHRRNVRFMLWISPQYRRKNCPPTQAPAGWLTGDDEYYLRDLTNHAERADFVRRLKALAALGVDGFKGDRGDEVDLERLTLTGGAGGRFQNAYPLLYERAVAEAMRGRHGRWASLFRSAVPGSSAVVPGFVGSDLDQTWNGLAAGIRMAQGASVAGQAMWGADVGGYAGGQLTADLFVRWAQFAALTPMFEVGGAGANAEFWQLGPAAVAGLRAAAVLHYELAPTLYELVREASTPGGLPPIRPLGLTWPRTAGAWRHDLEFTLGGGLLAAPVTAPAATATTVYLPPGGWFDFFDGRRLAGGRTVSRVSGSTEFPLYVRAGSAIAYDFRAPSVWRSPWRVDDLVRTDRQGWLVAPGGWATARSGRTALTATTVGGRVRITLAHAAREQQLLVLASAPPRHVTVNGAPVPHVAVAGLPEHAAGWAWVAARRAVLVKLTAAATATIDVG